MGLATGPLSTQGGRRAVLYSTFEGLASGPVSGKLICTARMDLIFIRLSDWGGAGKIGFA